MEFLDAMPIWLIYLLVIGLILLCTEVGFRVGLVLRQRGTLPEKDSLTNTMVGALLGLLAFFLTFSIGFALNNFNARRQLVLSEANAIGTAYLRTGFLDETFRTEAQELFREYLDLRFTALVYPEQLEDIIRRGEEIQNQLWVLTEANAQENPGSETVALYAEALNEVIDLQTVRVVSNQSLQVPIVFWWILLGIIVLSFLLVGVASSSDKRRNYLALAVFSLAFAAAFTLLVDLDNPQSGLLEVGQSAMISLQQQIGTPMP